MLNSGEKKFATKKDYSNSCVDNLSEKKILNEKKKHSPLQVKWSVPNNVHMCGAGRSIRCRLKQFFFPQLEIKL